MVEDDVEDDDRKPWRRKMAKSDDGGDDDEGEGPGENEPVARMDSMAALDGESTVTKDDAIGEGRYDERGTA